MAAAAAEQDDGDVTWISSEEQAADGSPVEGDETPAEDAEDGKGSASTDEAEDKTAESGEKEGDDKAADKPDYKKQYSDLEGRYKSLESHKQDLDRAISGLRKEIKSLKAEKKEVKPDDPDYDFSDGELANVLKAHDGDHDMQIKVMKQLAKQLGKKVEQSAAEQAEIKAYADKQAAWITTNIPAAWRQDNKFQEEVEKARSLLKIEDHPYADFLAHTAQVAMMLPQIVQTAIEKATKESVAGKVEDKRKEAIKDSKPKAPAPPKPKGASVELTASQMEACKNIFGPSPSDAQIRKYASMIR